MIPPVLRSAWSRLLDLWRPMAAWSVVVWGLLVTVLTPISATLVGWVWHRGDEAVVANEALLAWFVAPQGAAWLLVAGSLALVGVVLQYAGFFEIVTAELEGEEASLLGLGLRLPRRLASILRLCAAVTAAALLLAVPLAAGLFGIKELLLGAQDINYYLYERPPRWWYAVGASGLWGLLWAAGVAWLAARSLLAVPAYLDGHRPLATAVRTSWERTRGDGARIVGLLLAAAGGWMALRALVGAILVTGSSAVVRWAATFDSLQPLLVATGGASLLTVAADAVVAFLGVAFVSTLLTKLYYEDTDLHAAAPPAGAATRDTSERLLRWAESWLRPGRALPLVGLAVVGSLVAGGALLERLPEEPDVEITSHRAGPSPAPENTLAALERSIRAGADWAEIDVQLTRDSVPVVIHDADLKRMTGDARRVARTDYEELAGLVQRPDDGSPPAERGVARLSEFLERSRGRIGLNIELKYYGADERLARRVVETVRDAGMTEDVMIMSLSLEGVRQVRRIAPEVESGYVAAAAVGDLSRLGMDFLALSRQRATAGLIREAGRQGVEVHVWTVNRAPAMVEVIHDGADGIITDRPGLAVRVRRELADLPVASRLLLRFGELAIDDEAVPDSASLATGSEGVP